MTNWRSTQFVTVNSTDYDVAIIGAGINGAVIAAALSSHGLSVLLIDKGDVAGVTSQASSNMVWGGFKYLESLDVGLVWSLCGSRNRMVDAYPSNVLPITFVANLDAESPHRPWFAYLGTLVYWAFGRFKTRRPRYLRPSKIEQIAPIINTSTSRGGIAYDDAYLPENDSRFVFQFARSAAATGATVLTYTEVSELESTPDGWKFTVSDQFDAHSGHSSARVLINAAGPFADGFNHTLDVSTGHRLALSKGIHLVVDRLADPDQVLVFYDDSGRLFYVLPMGSRSSIGTTDTRVDAPTSEVTSEDRDFLLAQINTRLDLQTPLTPSDVISTRAGVRPLVVEAAAGDTSEQDWTTLSRKHVIESDPERNVISILGGKLTDCVNVGEEVLEAVTQMGLEPGGPDGPWYGEPPAESRDLAIDACRDVGLNEATQLRLWRRYGDQTIQLVDAIRADPGARQSVFDFDELMRCEVDLMARTEMLTTLEDLLRRRTMLELIHGRDKLLGAPELGLLAELAFGESGPRAEADYRGESHR